jgi:uncharacterized membrane protein YeaQ/YmgE (transglycosylase-associated protein family)
VIPGGDAAQIAQSASVIWAANRSKAKGSAESFTRRQDLVADCLAPLRQQLTEVADTCCKRIFASRRFLMTFSDRNLLVILIVGIIAGWIAGKVVRGAGFGLVGDAAIGIVGGIVGEWLSHRFDIHILNGFAGFVLNAALGAILVLMILRVVGASSWGSR